MKRNFISLIVAIGLICALTIGSSADFYGTVTDEAVSQTGDESSSDESTRGFVTDEFIPRTAVNANGNHTLNIAVTQTEKKASQNVKVTVKKKSQDTESTAQTSTDAGTVSGSFIDGSKLKSGTRSINLEFQHTPKTDFFTDVPQDSYYFDAVKWAIEKGVTNGTSATAFSPGNTCTRAQVVTFFWRNAGQPEPSSQTNPFSDVQEGSYYYKAVLWAVERGITNGTSATAFSPNQPCSYAHVVTFLWRLKNPGESNQGEGAWYAIPAAWANSGGFLTGTNFNPNQPCPRSDIVTYLYRSRPDRIDVSMSTAYSDGKASAVIEAYDSDGHTLWSHATGEYFRAELEPIEEIGMFGGQQYVYVEGGNVIALDLYTGAVRWKNDDFAGAGVTYCVGENGVFYLCGYYDPVFFGVDMNGNTVGRIATFSDDYFWAYNIQRVDENHMSVLMEGSEIDYDGDKAFLVDLRDFSYEGPFDEDDSRVAPKVAPFLSGAWILNGERVSRIDVEQIGNLYLFYVSWKGGNRWSFSGKWENGVIRYADGVYSHKDGEFEWGETGTVRLSGDTLIWTDGDESHEYVRFYDAPTEY